MIDFKAMDDKARVTGIVKELVRDVNGMAAHIGSPSAALKNPEVQRICKLIDAGRERIKELEMADKLAEAVLKKYMWEN